MRLAGIVAEFNPLHNGHKYIIDCAKCDGFAVACVISGNFVQRGDCAIIPKFKRAQTALEAGVDIICELPVPWSMSTAQNFAFGSISQLAALGVDTLYFGSECGNFDLLNQVSNLLLSKEFENAIKQGLNSGETYAKIRQNTVLNLLGEEASNTLQNPNDTLGIEYISAAKKLGLNLNFVPIKRIGAGHNDKETVNSFSSSSFIREKVLNGDYDGLSTIMPECSLKVLSNSPIANISKIDTAIVSKIKQMSLEEIKSLPDLSEGMENLIFSAARNEHTYQDLCNAIKSKRYTMARIRRILLSGFLGIEKGFFNYPPPYVRILGFTNNGLVLLPKNSKTPIITRVSQINDLNDFSKKVFKTEMQANELYSLSLSNPKLYINEQKEKIIKK